jgi:PAS domain S-box-containing protein
VLDPFAATVIAALALMGLRVLTRSETSAATWWFAGWFAAGLSGALYMDRMGLPALGSVGIFVGTLSPALILIGVIVLVGRSTPAWLLPAALGFGVLRGVLGLLDYWTLAQALGLIAGPPAAAASGWLAHRSVDRETASIARRLLAPSLIAVAILGASSEIADAMTGTLPIEFGIAWLMLVPPTFVLQLSALTEHSRDALLRSGLVLEQRVEARTQELDRAIESLQREVEERRSAEAALRESEERYRNISELSSDFSFQLRLDPNHGIRREWVTEAFERITGYPADSLDGDGWTALLASAERLDAKEAVDSAAGDEVPKNRLHRIVRADGEARWLSLRFHTQRSPVDGELRVIGAASDVTEAKLAEEARLDLALQMEEAQRVESLGLLTGGIAHDFNNLLAVILGNVRLVQDELPADSPPYEKLARARAAATHAASLTEQMLSYSGKASVKLEPVDVSQLTRELEGLLRASVGANCALTVELGEDATVAADATRLRQVLVNLATNASESLESRPGHVTIRTGRSKLQLSDLSNLVGARNPAPGDYTWFEVCDDGPGMEPETQRRIFEPFYTTKFSGRGLGLASSLGIVRAHAGLIDLESEPGRGTRVRVLIPSHDGAGARPGRHEKPTLRNLHVLVVDDDPAVLELATEFLVREGCIAVPADGGKRALALFADRDEDFDAAVLDLAMPEFDGRLLFRELRKLEPELPVVLATGYSRDRLTENFAGESRVEFLRKPYTVEELVEALAAVVESRDLEQPDTS